jgi:hypothetical protein
MKWIVTKEAVVGIVRTGMAYLWALLLAQVPFIQSFLVDEGWFDAVDGFVSGGFVLLAGTVIYSLIRWLAENPKFEFLGYLLVFNDKPTYTDAPAS